MNDETTLTDNLLPNDTGTSFDEQERLDEYQQAENEERKMVNSITPAAWDWVDEQFTTIITELDTMTAARTTAKTEQTDIETAATAHSIAITILRNFKDDILARREHHSRRD